MLIETVIVVLLCFVKKIQLFLAKINVSHAWVNHGTFSKVRLLNAVMLKLKDYYI